MINSSIGVSHLSTLSTSDRLWQMVFVLNNITVVFCNEGVDPGISQRGGCIYSPFAESQSKEGVNFIHFCKCTHHYPLLFIWIRFRKMKFGNFGFGEGIA